MKAKITFFPVDNGDMTLVQLADPDQTCLLIDMHIRQAADDPDDDTRDVAKDLRERLKRDSSGRPYVDAFLLTHPDKDHCSGLENHFHLGALEDYADDEKDDTQKKIVIRQLWSSPMIFRRASKTHTLCDDAKAFNTEAKRRVQANLDQSFINIPVGDRILILGKDIDSKTDDLNPILIKEGGIFFGINGSAKSYLKCHLLAPDLAEDDDTESRLSKKPLQCSAKSNNCRKRD